MGRNGRSRNHRMEAPQTHYLEHEGVNIAWQMFGDGPAEILFIPGWVSNVDQFWEHPEPRAFFSELAALRPCRRLRQAGHRSLRPRRRDAVGSRSASTS